jgi:hypothetical protein
MRCLLRGAAHGQPLTQPPREMHDPACGICLDKTGSVCGLGCAMFCHLTLTETLWKFSSGFHQVWAG